MCSKLKWHGIPREDQEAPRSPRTALDVKQSRRKTKGQSSVDPKNSQHMVNTYNKKFSNVVGFGFAHLNECMITPTLLI